MTASGRPAQRWFLWKVSSRRTHGPASSALVSDLTMMTVTSSGVGDFPVRARGKLAVAEDDPKHPPQRKRPSASGDRAGSRRRPRLQRAVDVLGLDQQAEPCFVNGVVSSIGIAE